MIRRVLVPLDGSALAESVLPAVQALATLTGAGVTLLQAVAPLEPLLVLPEDRGELALDRAEQAAAERDAVAYLATVARRLTEQHLIVDSRVVTEPPAGAIIRIGMTVDLIAMATHGRSGVGRWVFGSVADKVLHGATVPVLLVRAGQAAVAAGWPRRILVPLDGSALAEQALPLAALLARCASAELILTCSIGWARAAAERALAIDVAGFGVTLPERAADQAHAYLTDIGQRLAVQGLAARSDIRGAPAAEAILASAAEQAADLIVMSTHGRSGLGRWTYGSVADRVLRGAPIPIVLVRAGIHVPAAPPAPATSAG